jgi:hypothetical protein
LDKPIPKIFEAFVLIQLFPDLREAHFRIRPWLDASCEAGRHGPAGDVHMASAQSEATRTETFMSAACIDYCAPVGRRGIGATCDGRGAWNSL